MESQPQNPEFRNNPDYFHPSEVEEGSEFFVDILIFGYISWSILKENFCTYHG